MKAKSFKKFFVSIALSAVLTLSTAATAFAATAQLMPADRLLNCLRKIQISLLQIIRMHRLQVPLTLPQPQVSARLPLPKDSVTVQWNPVTNAAKYAVSISNF